jgi:hypothetical protein
VTPTPAPAARSVGSISRSGSPALARVAFALLLLACQSPPTPPVPPMGGEVCEDLAYIFLLVAEERDRGSTKEAQIEILRKSADDPFVARAASRGSRGDRPIEPETSHGRRALATFPRSN